MFFIEKSVYWLNNYLGSLTNSRAFYDWERIKDTSRYQVFASFICVDKKHCKAVRIHLTLFCLCRQTSFSRLDSTTNFIGHPAVSRELIHVQNTMQIKLQEHFKKERVCSVHLLHESSVRGEPVSYRKQYLTKSNENHAKYLNSRANKRSKKFWILRWPKYVTMDEFPTGLFDCIFLKMKKNYISAFLNK